MIIFVIHLSILIALSYYSAKRIWASLPERVFAVYIIIWSNLVVTALLLSVFSKLGDSVLYFRLSVLLGLLSILPFLRKPHILEATEHQADVIEWWNPKKIGYLSLFLYITLFVAFCLNLLIAYKYSPNNWDSLTYHLPRIHFYLSQGSLSHFETVNFRQTFFPFNVTLFQMFLVRYGQPDKLLNLLNLFSWALAFLAVYSLCRSCKAGHPSSLLAAWAGVMAPQVFSQATATTNDLLTAVPVLIGVIFSYQWIIHRRFHDAVIAGLAVGLAFGSKLTTFFFAPAILAILLIFAGKVLKDSINKRLAWSIFRKSYHVIVAAVLAFAMTIPFLIANYRASGKFKTDHYDFLLNRPFSIYCSLQTMYAYVVQLFLEPFQRLGFFHWRMNEFKRFYDPILTQLLFPGWNKNYAVSDLSIFPNDLSENTVFFGFLSLFVAIVFIYAVTRPQLRRNIAFVLILMALGWFVAYAATSKWSWYNQRYFVASFLLSMPLLSVVYEEALNKRFFSRRFFLGLFAVIICTTLFFDMSYLTGNSSRTLLSIFRPNFDQGRVQIPVAIRKMLAVEKEVKFVYSGYTHGDERLYQFMNHGANQRFYIGQWPDPDKYNMFSFWAPTVGGMFFNIPSSSAYTLIPIPWKRSRGISVLGELGEGLAKWQYYGSSGSGQKEDATIDDSNIIVRVLFDRFAKEGKLLRTRLNDLKLDVFGLTPRDDTRLVIYYTDAAGKNIQLSETDRSASYTYNISGDYQRLYIEAYDKAVNGGKSIGEIRINEFSPNKTYDLPLKSSERLEIDLLKDSAPVGVTVKGLGLIEGPYTQWNLPKVRWAKREKVTISFDYREQKKGAGGLQYKMSFRPQVRPVARMVFKLNDKVLKTYQPNAADVWQDEVLNLSPKEGINTIELFFEPVAGGLPPPDSLYMLFRSLSLCSVEKAQ